MNDSLLKNDSLLFRRLMENFNESVFFKDTESRFISINHACAKKFGLSDPEEAVGKTDFDFFDDAHARPALDDERYIIETGKPILNKIEKEVFRESGKTAWTSTSKFPLYDDNEMLIGTYGITKDVTIQKEIEGKLIENTHRLSKLSEMVPGLFYLFQFFDDGRSCMPFSSKAIEVIFELTSEEVKDSIEPVMNRVHPDDLRKVMASIEYSATKLKTWDCEFRVVLPKRGVRWVHGKAMPEEQRDGSVIGYGYVTDITGEKKILDANIKLKQQFKAILNGVPNLIFVKDEEGRYQVVNEATAEFFGKTIDEIIGKTDIELGIDREEAQHFTAMEQRVINSEEPVVIPERMLLDPDGEEVWHQTMKVPFMQIGNNRPAVLSIVTDVTRQKRNEIELQESLDIISEQNKRLNNFAHIVSHNLRNHAGNISMLLSLYDVEETDEERVELMGFLKTGSERLNETIKDLNVIIDQQYKNEVVLKEVALGEYITKTKEVLTTEILKHKVQIVEDIEEGLTFDYNPAYLESILLNLMSNGIKYRHPERDCKLRIKAFRKQGSVYLEVRDNGLGIDMEQHGDKLFGMYKTFHGNENAKGIGLFITKNQIESMGGTIKVQSEPGKGTTFKIKLT